MSPRYMSNCWMMMVFVIKIIRDFVQSWAICNYQFQYWCRFCGPSPESNILFQDTFYDTLCNEFSKSIRKICLSCHLTPDKQFVKYIQNDLATFPMTVLFNRMWSLALIYLCLFVGYIVVEEHCLEQNCL